MKKTSKIAVSIALVGLFSVTSVQEAKAWRFFGQEVTFEIGVNELACGTGCSGVYYEYTNYFFGIPISSGSATECYCP